MPTNFTEHYQFNQWERTDKILMDDFNADNAKIDAALAEEKAIRETETSALNMELAKKGNCQIYVGSYVGAGGYGQERPNTFTFPARPDVFFIFQSSGSYPVIGSSFFSTFITVNDTIAAGRVASLSWDGNTVSWYDVSEGGQLNAKGHTYYVVALFRVDE